MDKVKTRVMVLEDESLLLKAIVTKLDSRGMEAIPFEDPIAALDYLRKSKDKLPDIIWLDYYLKNMNGMDFMQQVAIDEDLKKIPVIVVSNSASDYKIESMLSLGVKRYILKADHRLEDIIGIINEVLNPEGDQNQNGYA